MTRTRQLTLGVLATVTALAGSGCGGDDLLGAWRFVGRTPGMEPSGGPDTLPLYLCMFENGTAAYGDDQAGVSAAPCCSWSALTPETGQLGLPSGEASRYEFTDNDGDDTLSLSLPRGCTVDQPGPCDIYGYQRTAEVTCP